MTNLHGDWKELTKARKKFEYLKAGAVCIGMTKSERKRFIRSRFNALGKSRMEDYTNEEKKLLQKISGTK